MLLLEGPQGKQKSKALRALAVKDAWFTDRLSHVANKDTALELAGNLIAELAEMDSYLRRVARASGQIVSYAAPRSLSAAVRQACHQSAASGCLRRLINPPTGGYLKDPTGSRRFWPVECLGMIDVDGIERDCDQLWAETDRALQ